MCVIMDSITLSESPKSIHLNSDDLVDFPLNKSCFTFIFTHDSHRLDIWISVLQTLFDRPIRPTSDEELQSGSFWIVTHLSPIGTHLSAISTHLSPMVLKQFCNLLQQ